MTTWRIHVIGKVQGVYFRVSTQEQARNHGLTGWVRNEPDGSVRMEVQGDPSGFDRFLKWIHQGPPRANVDEVIVEKVGESKDYKDFEIVREFSF